MRKDKIEPTITFSCSTISVYLLKIRVGTVEDEILKKPMRQSQLGNSSHRSKKLLLANVNVCKVKIL